MKQASPGASARSVACPTCGGPSVYGPQNRWRPFCSARCKNNDLGAWASEQFRVATQEQAPADDLAGSGQR